jgi:hypothetical protein
MLPENYFLPGDLEAEISAFIEHYNPPCYHKSLGNVTPADASVGGASDILADRNLLNRQTIQYRRLQHRKVAA